MANAPREQAAIDLSRVDTADPTDDPDNDAEPAALQKDEWQPASALPGTADPSSAAAAALAMDVDPDRMLHSFEIDSAQVHGPVMRFSQLVMIAQLQCWHVLVAYAGGACEIAMSTSHVTQLQC